MNAFRCRDGQSYFGSVCALLQIYERTKIESRIDVFRVVKDLKDRNKDIVESLVG